MVIPRTRYARVGDAQIAYQVLGDGPDLVYSVGVGSHVDLQWDSPVFARYFRELASFSRLILFDRRGTGASDPSRDLGSPTWEDWAEDVRAVLQAVRSTQAIVFAEAEAGPTAIMFAATEPDRVRSLVLGNTTARYLHDHDYPIGLSPHTAARIIRWVESKWGRPEAITTDNQRESERIARLLRASATPRAAAAQHRYVLESLDARAALPVIQVPAPSRVLKFVAVGARVR